MILHIQNVQLFKCVINIEYLNIIDLIKTLFTVLTMASLLISLSNRSKSFCCDSDI